METRGRNRRLAWVRFVLLAAVLAACAGPLATSWPQFHGGGSGQGSLFEPTAFALQPAWEFDVGPYDSGKPASSPVIGPERVIYIGNLDGDIIALNPDGTESWRATTPFRIFAAPAVADDGRIYALGVSFFPGAVFPDNAFRGTLMTLAPDGTVLDLTALPDQGFTGGAPRVWSSGGENWVFVHATTRLRVLNSKANALLVFDEDGNLAARQDLGCSLPVTGGPSIFDLLKDLWDLLSIEFDESGVPPDPDDYGPPDPTVAVVARPDIVGEGNALVVVADQACDNLSALRWNPATQTLSSLWFVDEGDKFHATSSPAIAQDARVVIGREDGDVIAYDLASGDKLWTYDAGEPVLGTPAALLRHIYVASRSHIQALEPATGEMVFKRGFVGGTFSSPALSATHVHLSHGREFQSFDLVLQVASHDSDGAFGRPGMSPAIGRDGTVYTVARRGDRVVLLAYPDN